MPEISSLVHGSSTRPRPSWQRRYGWEEPVGCDRFPSQIYKQCEHELKLSVPKNGKPSFWNYTQDLDDMKEVRNCDSCAPLLPRGL